MVWTTENNRTFDLESSRVTATCTVLKLADGSYQGFVGWKEDGKIKNAQTEPFDTDLEAMSATEKLLAKLELEIEGAPVVDNEETPTERTKSTFETFGMSRFDILESAKDALERGVEKHGKPETSFACIRRLWNAYLQNRPNPEAPLVDSEVADLMELMKIGRGQVQPQIDGYIDRAGYAALAGELAVKEGGVQRPRPRIHQPRRLQKRGHKHDV